MTWLWGCALVACESTSGPSLRIEVAPLALEGVAVVCYDLAVRGPDGVVWSRGEVGVGRDEGDGDALCSDRYGNGAGGDLAYVATCDASAPTNTVTLWVDGLYGGDGDDIGGWADPCPNGCTRVAPCAPDTDTAVSFDLTIARRAAQGFFDVVVDFADVFCAGKVDTCDAGQRPLAQLFAADGRRHATAVIGLACSGGPGADTHIYYSDVVVDCGAAGRWELAPSAGPGNVRDPAGAVGDGVWQFGVYEGAEALACPDGRGGLTDCAKRYWNLAIGIEGLPAGCRLEARATASDGAFEPPGTTPDAVYPVLRLSVPLTDADGIVCQRVPLGTDGFDVDYTTTPEPLAHELRGLAGGGVETVEVARVPDGLIAHLDFDAGFSDVSGHGHDGAATDGYALPPRVAGCKGQAARFDGNGQFVALADAALLGPGNGRSRTITALVKLAATGGNGFIFASQYQNYNVAQSIFAVGASFRTSPWMVGALANGTAAVYREPTIDGRTRFVHYAYVFDTAAHTATVYADGVELGSGPLSYSDTSTRPVTVGGLLPPEPHYFAGDIDDVMFFDRALDADEIATLAALTNCD